VSVRKVVPTLTSEMRWDRSLDAESSPDTN
jgi:hypothetical protein